jgi:shikimate 5-dehydrogenase
MAFPQYTKIFHNFSYPAIEPSRPELSTAGKVVFITGGGSGIGPRIAHAFAKSGAAKIIIMGRTESSLLSTKNEVETEFPKSSVLTCKLLPLQLLLPRHFSCSQTSRMATHSTYAPNE